MKKLMAVFMVVSLLSVAAPLFAMDHGDSQDSMDEQCAKECEMLLKSCGNSADTIQERINKLQNDIKEKGASASSRDDLRKLEQQLQDAKETLRRLETR